MRFSATSRSTVVPCAAAISLSVCPGCTTTTRSLAAAGSVPSVPAVMATTRAPARKSGLVRMERGSEGRCNGLIVIVSPVLGAQRVGGEPSALDGRPMLGGDPDRSRYLRVGKGYFGTVVWAPLRRQLAPPPTLSCARGASEHPCYTGHRFVNGLHRASMRTELFPSHTLADLAIHGARRAARRTG